MFILINNNNNARMLSYDAIILHIWFSECSKLLVYSNTIVIDNNNSNILIVIIHANDKLLEYNVSKLCLI